MTQQIGIDQPVFMNAGELANTLGVSERTIWRMLSCGKIIEPVRIGGSTKWHRTQVENWIAKGCPTPTNDNN